MIGTKAAYKRKRYLGICLQFQKFCSCSPWQKGGAWLADIAPEQSVAESLPLIQKLEAEISRLGLVWAFKTSKPTSSDRPPPARSHALILPTGNQLWTKSSNIWASGSVLIQTTTVLQSGIHAEEFASGFGNKEGRLQGIKGKTWGKLC